MTTTWSRHSRRIEPISRSAYAFCHGLRAAVGLLASSKTGCDDETRGRKLRDDVIEHVAAAASYPTLGDSVLSWALDRGLHASNSHGANWGRNRQPVFLVVIEEQELGSGLIGECFP
jgi:hypothetical protein